MHAEYSMKYLMQELQLQLFPIHICTCGLSSVVCYSHPPSENLQDCSGCAAKNQIEKGVTVNNKAVFREWIHGYVLQVRESVTRHLTQKLVVVAKSLS